MNKMLAIGTSVLFTIFAGSASAVDEHHPADAKPVISSTSKPAMPAAKQSDQAGMQMQQMDEMMKKMQVMHDKMMAAKTPDERCGCRGHDDGARCNGKAHGHDANDDGNDDGSGVRRHADGQVRRR